MKVLFKTEQWIEQQIGMLIKFICYKSALMQLEKYTNKNSKENLKLMISLSNKCMIIKWLIGFNQLQKIRYDRWKWKQKN